MKVSEQRAELAEIRARAERLFEGQRRFVQRVAAVEVAAAELRGKLAATRDEYAAAVAAGDTALADRLFADRMHLQERLQPMEAYLREDPLADLLEEDVPE